MTNWVWQQDAAVSPAVAYTLTALKGAYTLTGSSVSKALQALTGAFALSGNDNELSYGRSMQGLKGTFTLTGNAISAFQKGANVFGQRGEYVLLGQEVTFSRQRAPVVDPAAYVETAWVQPENEGNLDAGVIVEQG